MAVTGPDQQEEVGLLLNSGGREEEARYLVMPLCPHLTVSSSGQRHSLMIHKGTNFPEQKGHYKVFY